MPERLEPNTIDTVTIFLVDLPDDLANQLQEVVALTFDKEDYLLLQGKELLLREAKEAANLLIALVDEKLQHGELSKVLPLRLNLALYTMLEHAAAERIEQMRGLVDRVDSKLGILTSYACVVKQNMRGEENAPAMDRCVEVCKAEGERPALPILLVNRGLGVTIDLPLKASVRYLHMISRNSRLKNQLFARTELITSIAMLEYDDEDTASLSRQIDKLQHELNGADFSKTQMIASVQALMTEYSERRLRPDRIDFSQMPIREDAIGNLFSLQFQRKKLNHALRDLERTFAQIYQQNIHAPDCDGCFQTEEARDALYKRMESFPTPYLREHFLADLEELERNQPPKYNAHIPRLRACIGEQKLREQLQEQYQRSLAQSRGYLMHVVIAEMKAQAVLYCNSGRVEQREKELKERILRLQAKARSVGNAKSAVDFLQTQMSFLPTQGGVPFQNRTNSEMILLISKRMDEDWKQYEPFLPSNPSFDVYNYGVLEEQALQALQITRFNEEHYQSNRKLIFQIR